MQFHPVEPRIGVVGDLHCSLGPTLKVLDELKAAGVTHILQVGDFGLWQDNRGRKFLYRVQKRLVENGQLLLVTLGNHENFTMLRDATDADQPGFQILRGQDRILYAKRPAVWEWFGLRFLSLGGANSIDKRMCKPNIDWWAEEQITYGDVLRTQDEGSADIAITHDAPTDVPIMDELIETIGIEEYETEDYAYAIGSRLMLDEAFSTIRPKLHFHGHYHAFASMTSQMPGGDNPNDELHSISMGMDAKPDNWGVLSLDRAIFLPENDESRAVPVNLWPVVDSQRVSN